MTDPQTTADPNCPRCHGKGEYMTERDAHRSAGLVPCGCRAPQTAPNLPHEIVDMIRAGKRIGAIKDLRAQRRLSLKEAYDLVDGWIVKHMPTADVPAPTHPPAVPAEIWAVAECLDYPGIRMEGPSQHSLRAAERVVEMLEDKGFAVVRRAWVRSLFHG